MKELLDKISSYNIFNFLLPGILFAVLGSYLLHIELIFKDLVVAPFVYYFIGLVISRIGSLVVEPVLRKIKFMKFVAYSVFCEAASKDPKIDVLSETNNMFRNFISMVLLLFVLKVYLLLADRVNYLKENGLWILLLVLMIIFLFAYRKQTKYITDRIENKK